MDIKGFVRYLFPNPHLIDLENRILEESVSEVSGFTNLFWRIRQPLPDGIQGFFVAEDSIFVSPYDLNSLGKNDSHPSNAFVAPGSEWGGIEMAVWKETFDQAFEIIRQSDVSAYGELRRHLKRIVPIGVDFSVHKSGSFSDCHGQIYLGLTLDKMAPYAMAEGILHEWNHNKIHLLNCFFPLFESSDAPGFHSPYRPDPRPLYWVLLGLHALQPVCHLFAKNSANLPDEYLRKIFAVQWKNSLALVILGRNAHFSDVWNDIFFELDHVRAETERMLELLPNGSDRLKNAKRDALRELKEGRERTPELRF